MTRLTVRVGWSRTLHLSIPGKEKRCRALETKERQEMWRAACYNPAIYSLAIADLGLVAERKI
jgi:hypothetical protein